MRSRNYDTRPLRDGATKKSGAEDSAPFIKVFEGERADRCRWQGEGGERVAAVEKRKRAHILRKNGFAVFRANRQFPSGFAGQSPVCGHRNREGTFLGKSPGYN